MCRPTYKCTTTINKHNTVLLATHTSRQTQMHVKSKRKMTVLKCAVVCDFGARCTSQLSPAPCYSGAPCFWCRTKLTHATGPWTIRLSAERFRIAGQLTNGCVRLMVQMQNKKTYSLSKLKKL